MLAHLPFLTRLLTRAAVSSVVCLALVLPSAFGVEVRIKDITIIRGERDNILSGIGVVTGLKGTGGTALRSRQLLFDILDRNGLRSDPRMRVLQSLPTNSIAMVEVTARLPVNTSKHDSIDVTVAVLDNSKSIEGGVLSLTPLFGVDNVVYAMASGPVIVGGFAAGGAAASVSKNHPTVGRIERGAIVEEEVCFDVSQNNEITLLLKDSDFTTAQRIAAAINQHQPGTARPEGKEKVLVIMPPSRRLERELFIAEVQQLTVVPDSVAKVVINERTGTVVFGQNVKISQANVNHANLTVATAETAVVSQPAPLSNGETTVVPRTDLEVIEQRRPIKILPETTTVKDLVAALNMIGVSPQDMVQIFLALDEAGALHAQLIVQ